MFFGGVRRFLRVCGYAVRGCRWSWDFLKYVITDTLNCATTPDPFGCRGEMAVSPPRCARLFSPHTDFSQDVGARFAQSVPQVRAVPNGKREVFGTLTCHRDDTGVSGRGVSLKLVRPSSSRNRARSGVSSMLTVGRPPARVWRATTAHKGSWCRGVISKPRDARYWWTCQRHRGNVGTMLLTRKRAPTVKGDQPQNWRATDPSTSGHQPCKWVSTRSVTCRRSVGRLPRGVSEVSSLCSTMSC